MHTSVEASLDAATRDFYTNSLQILIDDGIPFLVGGAFALNHYTCVNRHTHDLDLFVRKDDCQRVLDALAAHGYATEMTFSHWLAKAYSGDTYIDVIFSSGNAFADVDQAWFDYSVEAILFGLPVRLCPPEEMIWSKSFVMERERFDGADVAHLLQACGPELDWARLVTRYGDHWRLLLAHLVLFLYIYPDEAAKINSLVLQDLLRIAGENIEETMEDRRICQGTLLSREQYLVDLNDLSYVDARIAPVGSMTAEQVQSWTDAIVRK